MDEDALLAWFGGKSYKRLKHKDKHKKIQERADDDNGNDDKSSQDFIRMEKVSREYVKIKNSEDKKKLDKGIRDSLKPAAPAAREVEPYVEPAMEQPAQQYLKEKDNYDKLKSKKLLKDSIAKADKDKDKKEPTTDAEIEAATGKPVDLTPVGETPKVKLDTRSQVTREERKTSNEAEKLVPIAAQFTQLQPPGASDFVAEAPKQGSSTNTLSPHKVPDETKALIEEQAVRDRAATPRIPTFANPALSPGTADIAIPNIPGGDGELKGIEVPSPDATMLPQIEAETFGTEVPKPQDPVLRNLSAEYRRAVSKPISVLGQQIDPAGVAYDLADNALGSLQSANNGLLKAPTGIARLANFLNYPIDKMAGTDAFGKNNKMLDRADAFIDTMGVTAEPRNQMERAFSAIGMLATPLPGVPTTLAGFAKASPLMIGINEGVYKVAESLAHRNEINPPVENRFGELEPRVTSMPAGEAKELQKKVDAQAATMIPSFAQANNTDVALMTIGAAGVIAALVTKGRSLKNPVAGRTSINAEKAIIEEAPISKTTPEQVLRSNNQNANFILEDQAKKFNDPELVRDISVSTRAGLAARVESVMDSGAVNTPGYSQQLTFSPKALVEFHTSRPAAEQQELSKALTVMDRVDEANVAASRLVERKAAEGVEAPKLTPDAEVGPNFAKMPAQPDIEAAQRVLADPKNAGTVKALAEMRVASARAKSGSGYWDEATASNMLAKRPNYVHQVETHDYNIVDGAVVNKTSAQKFSDSFLSRQGENENAMSSSALNSSLARSRVNAPNQTLDAVLANVQELQQTIVKSHENDLVRRFHDGIKRDSGFEKSMMELKEGQAVPKGFDALTYYKDGQPVRIAAEPRLIEALRFSPTSAAATANVVAGIRNRFQALTTGPVAAPFFAATSFAMESTLGAASRARGLRLGYIDQAVQAVSGGTRAARGDLVGTVAAGLVHTFGGVRADNLLKAITSTEKYLLAHGDQNLAAMEQQMPGFTKKVARGLAIGQETTLANVVAHNREIYEQTPKGWGLKNGALHSSQNEMLRELDKFQTENFMQNMAKYMPTPEAQGFADYWQRTVGNYKSFVMNLHEGPRLAQIAANKGRVPDNVLAAEVRRSTGDLGVRGSGNYGSSYILASDTSKAAQVATKALTSQSGGGGILDHVAASVPYINPHIQGTARFLEQMAKNPGGMLMGAFGAATFPHVASLATAMALGPEYVDYLLNKREEYKKTGYIYVPLGGSPENGMDIRLDPILAPMGYPIIEAIDSVFGLRAHVAEQMNAKRPRLARPAPNAEAQGLYSAMSDAFKEAVGISLPIGAAAALATQGFSGRNVLDPMYQKKTEQTVGIGSGSNASSALSVPVQSMLETMFGAMANHAVAGMDAYVSTGKDESAVANGLKSAGTSWLLKAPLANKYFGVGGGYNESGTVLAANTRKLLDSANAINDAIENRNNALKKNKSDGGGEDGAMPNIKMGYPGIASIPPEAEKAFTAVHDMLSKGDIKEINSERSKISTALSGLRGVNAGNISRHLLVPYKEGKEVGGLGYTIVNAELLKTELGQEQFAKDNPKLTPVKQQVSKKQDPRPVEDVVGGMPKLRDGRIYSPDEKQFYKPPTLAQVQGLKNALNERRYTLDLHVADALEGIEKQLGIKLNDVAKMIKLTPSQDKQPAPVQSKPVANPLQ